jgi:succinate dehydrogenase / fumarate reductase iron-sulfur subunit
MLACKTQAVDIVRKNKVTLQPQGNFKILKDLVVDLTEFWQKIEATKPWLMADEKTTPEIERKQSIDEFHKIDSASTCIMCANCYSDCCSSDVDKSFLGPAALAKAQRFVEDSRDIEKVSRIKELSKDSGIWDCAHCAECSQRCPTDAKPLERIGSLRTVALNNGVLNNNGGRHAKAFVKSIKSSGILNENYLPVASVGFANLPGLLGLIPVGIRMFLRGKNPPLIHHAIKELDDVKRIFKKLGEK